MDRNRLKRYIPRRTYRLRGGIARGLKHRGLGIGDLLTTPPADGPEERVLREQDLGGRTIYDIGADTGRFTSFFADRAGAHGAVVAFEPNPVSYERALEQIRVNGQTNVTILNVAVGDEEGHLTMTFGDRPGEGSANPAISEALRSGGGTSERRVPAVTLDGAIADRDLPPPQFAKIDVEGFELQVLRGMSTTIERDRPTLFIELHGIGEEAKRANAEQVVELLLAAGYEIVHVETSTAVSSVEQSPPEGHLLCAAPRRV